MRWLVLIAVAACGSSSTSTIDGSTGDGTAPGTLAPDHYVDALESAQCDYMVRCQIVEDRATCDAAEILDNQQNKTLLHAIDDGTVTYDAVAAKACIDWLGMQSCSFAGFHIDNPCTHIFKGTIANGGHCFIDQQCAGGGSCDQVDPICDAKTTCCPGICNGSISESAIDGPCDDGMHICGVDAYCKANKCAALATTEGATCDSIDGCANPMYCNAPTGTGTCKTPAASGATCVRGDVKPCVDSRDYCDASNKCVRGADPGQPCGGANNIQCIDYAKCIGNTCVADRKLGESCTASTTAARCAGTLVCSGGTCQAPPGGMTCAL